MRADIIVEQNKEGYFSCYLRQELPYVAPLGYGETSQEAIDGLISFYEEERAELAKEGKELPELTFSVHYDMPSFFNRFSFLNVSRIAEIAGINPSLMRKYSAGLVNAGQQQYDKLHAAVQKIAREMLAASF